MTSFFYVPIGAKASGDGISWRFGEEYSGSGWWWWKLGFGEALFWLDITVSVMTWTSFFLFNIGRRKLWLNDRNEMKLLVFGHGLRQSFWFELEFANLDSGLTQILINKMLVFGYGLQAIILVWTRVHKSWFRVNPDLDEQFNSSPCLGKSDLGFDFPDN